MILTAQILLFIIALTFIWFATINLIIVVRQWKDPNYKRSKTVIAFTAQFVVIAIALFVTISHGLEVSEISISLLLLLTGINIYCAWIYRSQLYVFAEPMITRKDAKRYVRKNIDVLIEELITELDNSNLDHRECERILRQAEAQINNFKNFKKT